MDSYSRVIAYLKVLLPLAALALLSTLFLLSRSIDPTATIPFARQEMEDRMRGQQVTGPFFSGTTDKGDEISVSAKVTRPAGAGGMADAEELRAHMVLSKGGEIELESDTGSVDTTTDRASFAGNVRITTSTGYTVLTDRLDTGIGTLSAETPGAVQATGPVGDLTAGQMQIGAKNKDGPVHMLFTNGVKLVYDPQKSRER